MKYLSFNQFLFYYFLFVLHFTNCYTLSKCETKTGEPNKLTLKQFNRQLKSTAHSLTTSYLSKVLFFPVLLQKFPTCLLERARFARSVVSIEPTLPVKQASSCAFGN